MQLPEVRVKLLRAPERTSSSSARMGAMTTGEVLSLRDVCAGRVGVVDLWHTKCTKCPAALEKLNSLTESFDDSQVLFIAAALSQGDGDEDMVGDLIQE